MVINGPYCGANRRLFYISWLLPLVLILILVIYSVKEILGFSSGEEQRSSLTSRLCERAGKQCDSRVEYCCEGANGAAFCCPISFDSEDSHSRRGVGWHRSLGFWNMWYFWLAIILMLAFCFTGCSYWRRRRQLQQLTGWTSRESTCPHPTDPSILVPFTMYEVPPEALLRFMQETSLRTAADQMPQETSPPSYNEVASKPGMYPAPSMGETAAEGSDCPPPPPYESISSSDAPVTAPSNVQPTQEQTVTPVEVASAAATPLQQTTNATSSRQ